MCRQRLDARDKFPSDVEEYLAKNGWSFSKAMYLWAVSKMKNKEGAKQKPVEREHVEELLKRHGITLENDNGYDSCYVYSMFRADYGHILTDEAIMAKMIKAYIDDPDAYSGMPFTRFYADLIGSGANAPWEDLM